MPTKELTGCQRVAVIVRALRQHQCWRSGRVRRQAAAGKPTAIIHNMENTERILFVCLGNVIRSPLAENLFRHYTRVRGLDGKYVADSAGTSSYHVGDPPDRRMRDTAASHGIEYSGRSRQLGPSDLDTFDLVVAMDETNAHSIQSLARSPDQKAKIRMLREFDPEAKGELDVPDPYYGGREGFEHTYQIIDRSVQQLLDALEQGQV